MIVFIDFETSGLNYYDPDFEVRSLALSWTDPEGEIISRFAIGSEIRDWMYTLHVEQHPVWAYNISFEMGVARCVFPDYPINWAGDVQRLVLVYDNGGEDVFTPTDPEEESEEEIKPIPGVGLKFAGPRILKKAYVPAEQEAYAYIREKFEVKKGREGAFLGQLPLDILERYNVADTENTLKLYLHITEYFRQISYNWTVDHAMYLSTARLVTEAKIRGIRVDVDNARNYVSEVEKEIEKIGEDFRVRFATEVSQVEDLLWDEAKAKLKTDKGKLRVLRPAFNVGSNKHLEYLFCKVLGLETQFKTAKEFPSFRKAHLPSWGEGGQMLAGRRQRMIVLSQTLTLLEKASRDGRYHQDLKVNGTATGRLAGGGGLNIQGLARRDKGLMGSLIADPGRTFVSIDMSAGEPTVSTQLAKDQNYFYATFGGVGKKPFYRGRTLYIDDIYLMFASVSPMFSRDMEKAFKADWNGKSFAQQWLEDPEVIKDALNKIRKNAKWIVLSKSYGLGPKGLVRQAYNAGFPLTPGEASASYKAFWTLFRDIKAYSTRLSGQVKTKKWLTNPFGFRLVPSEHKAYNYVIQSSVSSILHWFCQLMADAAPWADFVTVIHDEAIYSVPDDRVEEFKQVRDAVTVQMNQVLQWAVDLRFGFATGKTLYEAK